MSRVEVMICDRCGRKGSVNDKGPWATVMFRLPTQKVRAHETQELCADCAETLRVWWFQVGK